MLLSSLDAQLHPMRVHASGPERASARHFPGEPFECPDKEQAARLYAMGLAKFLPPVGISRK